MTGLIGWWPLHRTVGDAVDLSGEGRGGTITGATRGVAGRGGLQAYSFDGSDDYVDVGTLGSFGSNLDTDFAFSFWIRTTSTGAIFSCFDDTNNENMALHIGNDGSFNTTSNIPEFALRDDDSTSTIGEGSTDITDGKWHHIVVNKVSNNGADWELWVDDTDEWATTSDQWDGGNLNDFNQPFPIGARNLRGTFDKNIDAVICDFRYYDRSLSAAEVTRLYEWGSQDLTDPSLHDGSDSGAVSRWDLNEDPGSTSTATDQWGSNDGTITGASQRDPAIRGTGLSFDGSDDEVGPIDDATLDITGNLTLSAWVYLESNKTRNPVVAKHAMRSAGSDTDYGMGAGDGKLFARIADGSSTNRVTNASTAPTGVWFHEAFVVGGNDLRLYKNGDEVGRADRTLNPTTDYALYIGRDNFHSVTIDGDIDDVRVYDRALSAGEIHDLYRWGTRGRDMRKELVTA